MLQLWRKLVNALSLQRGAILKPFLLSYQRLSCPFPCFRLLASSLARASVTKSFTRPNSGEYDF